MESKALADEISVVFAVIGGFVCSGWLRKNNSAEATQRFPCLSPSWLSSYRYLVEIRERLGQAALHARPDGHGAEE